MLIKVIMSQKILLWINGALAIAVFLSLLLFFISNSSQASDFKQPPVFKQKTNLPRHSFQLSDAAYKQIKDPVLNLEFKEPNLSLPDIRPLINYYGKNKRPDASPTNQNLYFSLGDPKAIISLKSGENVYLIRNEQTKAFQLSPKNQPTSLWIVASPLGKEASIDVYMKGVEDTIVREPNERAKFKVVEKPIPLQTSTPWSLGPNKVDGTLLLKQKAKWNGPDLFLTLYGGPEYEEMQGKQRISFGEGEDQYSLFVAAGDVLIWKDDHWQVPQKGENTQAFPLLEVKKVDDRILSTELWDADGKTKIPLNMIKTHDPIPNIDFSKSFQFMGARTKIHFMFKIDEKREIVAPGDWFVMIDGRWQKVKKSKDIDQIVQRELAGPLLILDSITQQGNKGFRGKLFNGTHSEMVEIEIPLIPKPKTDVPRKSSEEILQELERVKGNLKADQEENEKPQQEAPANRSEIREL